MAGTTYWLSQQSSGGSGQTNQICLQDTDLYQYPTKLRFGCKWFRTCSSVEELQTNLNLFLYVGWLFCFFFIEKRQLQVLIQHRIMDNCCWSVYIVLFSTLEQTHCTHMWFYMSDYLFMVPFWISTKVVYLQRWHGWCHMKLLLSQHSFCVLHTIMLHSLHAKPHT